MSDALDAIFQSWSRVCEAGLLESEDLAAAPPVVYQFEIIGAQTRKWFLDCSKQVLLDDVEEVQAVDCTVRIKEEHLIALTQGKLNPQLAYVEGLVEISGNLSAALYLSALLEKLNPTLRPE